MKVTLVDFGGFTDYTIQLANSLADLVDLYLLFGKPVLPQKLALLHSYIQYEVFDKPNRDSNPKSPAIVWQIFRRIWEIAPEVLHVQESQTPWFELGLLAYGLRAQLPGIVVTVHDAHRHPGDDPIHLYEQTQHLSIKKADIVIAHAQSVKRQLITQFGIRDNEIRVLPHGELGSLFRRLSSCPVPVREPNTLLFFGRIVRYKGLDCLVEAMPLVRCVIPDARLIVAGRGGDLQEYAHKVGPPCEVYPEYIPEDRVAELFQRAGVLVLPYIEASQSGVANIGLGLGTPVIASATGGLKELIRDGEDGLLVPPGDSGALATAIIRLLSNRDIRSKIRENMRARCAADLAWDNIAKETFAIYQEVLCCQNGEKKCA